MERKLTAILAADVAGFSRLMGEDEEATLGTLGAYREKIDALVGEHHGRIFAQAGDSVLAEFASPVEAVRAAVAVQRAVERENAGLPEGRRMRFRIGVNLGDVMAKGGDLFGDGVNVAARLEGLAAPGGIWISDSVFQQVKNKVAFGYERRGAHAVKNIAEPVLAYRVLMAPEAAGTVVDAPPQRRGVPRRAVLTALAALVLAGGGAVLWWRPWVAAVEAEAPEPLAFPQLVRPTRHFRVQRPADLADSDALIIYDRILDDMAALYGKSGNAQARAYRGWRR